MRRASALAVCAAAVVTACAGPDAGVETLTVYAATSLTQAFADVEEAYEARHPDVDVVMVFAGSADLAAQIREGAPADVFASASPEQMHAVAGHVTMQPEVFATNTATIVVEAGNPLGIEGMADLADPAIDTVACAPQVPCGQAALATAAAAGVPLSPVSEESSVSDVLGKVASGQADAGIVYVTDISRSAAVEEVAVPGAATSDYVIAALTDGAPAEFVNFVLSSEGAAILATHGFGAP